MFAERARSLQGIAALLDATCIVLASLAAFALRPLHESLPVLRFVPATQWQGDLHLSDYAVVVLTNLLVWLTYARATRLYRPSRLASFRGVVASYFKASVLSVFVTGAAVFALRMSVSRLFFGYFIGIALALLVVKQLAFSRLVRRLQLDPARQRSALVIGPPRPGGWFLGLIRRAASYRPVGVLLPDDSAHDGTRADIVGPVLGCVKDLDRLLASQPVDEVFLVGSARDMAGLGDVAERLVASGRVVSFVPIVSSGAAGVRGRVTSFQDIPVVTFGPRPRDEVQRGLKRVLDVAVSGLALLLLSPLFVAVALLIKLLDPGPMIFSQQRLGLHGRPFRLYKFRSMRVDAEQVLLADPTLARRYRDNGFKLPTDEDPRVTRLGRLLRKTSLDELPQLFNVLMGDMTLVGPRPIVPDEIANYGAYASLFLSVPPGITGQWQVSGRSDIAYPDRAFLDLDYVSAHSLSGDLRIIASTVPAVLRRDGAS